MFGETGMVMSCEVRVASCELLVASNIESCLRTSARNFCTGNSSLATVNYFTTGNSLYKLPSRQQNKHLPRGLGINADYG